MPATQNSKVYIGLSVNDQKQTNEHRPRVASGANRDWYRTDNYLAGGLVLVANAHTEIAVT